MSNQVETTLQKITDQVKFALIQERTVTTKEALTIASAPTMIVLFYRAAEELNEIAAQKRQAYAAARKRVSVLNQTPPEARKLLDEAAEHTRAAAVFDDLAGEMNGGRTHAIATYKNVVRRLIAYRRGLDPICLSSIEPDDKKFQMASAKGESVDLRMAFQRLSRPFNGPFPYERGSPRDMLRAYVQIIQLA